MSDTHCNCNCTMAQRLVGDGCRYCQPDTYIDILSDELADLRAYKERTEAGLRALCSLSDAHDRPSLVRLGLWRDPPQAEVQP